MQNIDLISGKTTIIGLRTLQRQITYVWSAGKNCSGYP